MLNQVLLVGRISHFAKCDDNTTKLVLKVKRPFKNMEGEYEYDAVSVYLTQWFADPLTVIGIGKLIMVRARIVVDFLHGQFIQVEKITMVEGGE